MKHNLFIHSISRSFAGMRSIPVIIMLLHTFLLSAQTKDYSQINVDDLFTLAKEKAFNGERDEARKICRIILERSPGYDDVSILMGRTYAWDGKRDEARKAFRTVLEKNPANLDATLALIDVELWDDKPEAALTEANKGITYHANDEALLIKKAKALIDLNREDEALVVLARIEEINPGCIECKSLKEGIKTRRFKHTVAASFAVDYYSRTYDPMYYSYIQAGTTTRLGGLIGRINYSHRFGDNGIQPEIDFYPRLFKGTYAYLNYGFTTSDLFARHRVGAEFYSRLPKSFEISAGIRYLNFGGSSDVMIYTGSLGWYHRNYWFSLRPYITPGNGSFSRSLNLTTRRYFSNPANFIGLTVGAGFSPDQRRIQSSEGLDSLNTTQTNIYFLNAQKAELTFQKSIRYNMTASLDFYYAHQELSFSYRNYVNVYGFTLGIKMRL